MRGRCPLLASIAADGPAPEDDPNGLFGWTGRRLTAFGVTPPNDPEPSPSVSRVGLTL